MTRRVLALVVIVAAAAIGWLVGTLLEPAFNAWLFTRKGAGVEPFREPWGDL